jgi:hypothetical protein
VSSAVERLMADFQEIFFNEDFKDKQYLILHVA